MPHDFTLWCEDCQKGYEGSCYEHGPLTLVSDTEVGTRARRSLPAILQLIEDKSHIGVYAREPLTKRLQFGPLQGLCVSDSSTELEEEIKTKYNIIYKLVQDRNELLLVDTRYENHSNWMIFVRPARRKIEQNLVAYQYKGEVFFASIKEIPINCELKVWFSKDYAEKIDEKVLLDESSAWQFRTRQRFVCSGCEIVFSSAASLSNHRCLKKQQAAPRKELFTSRKRTKKSTPATVVAPPAKFTSTFQSLPSTSTGRGRYPFGKRVAIAKGIRVGVKRSFESSDNSDSESEETKEESASKASTSKIDKALAEEKPFVCDQCEKAFSSRFKLGRHQLIHTSERQHHCPLCNRSFRRKDHLKNHIQIHDPNKQFKCDRPNCGKEYSSYMSYRKHRAFHAVEDGDLECKICLELFNSKSDLLYHLKVHVGTKTAKSPSEKKFQCEQCDRKFFTRKDVKRHMVVHTGKRDFVCNLCPQKFGRKDHLVRHIKKSHMPADAPKTDQDYLSTAGPSLVMPGPSSVSPELLATSSTSVSSCEPSFSPLLLTEEFAPLSESTRISEASSILTTPTDSPSTSMVHSVFTPRQFQSELKYFDVKEDPELTASMESLGSNNDDISKILGMYLPSGSINLAGSSLLDPGPSHVDQPSPLHETVLSSIAPHGEPPLLLEASSIYRQENVINPLLEPEPIESSRLGSGTSLDSPLSELIHVPTVSGLQDTAYLQARTSEAITVATTTTSTASTTSLPGFEQAFP